MVITKRCTKCKRMLPSSEFYKAKGTKKGLRSQCKECKSRYYYKLKKSTMIAFGGRCVHVDENGIQCSKNVDDNLEELQTSHPNGDGNEHRKLVSNGQYGLSFYSALKKRNWYTDGFVIEIRCRSHHRSLDKSGKKHHSYGKHGKSHYNYKEGNFSDPVWLKKKYETMTSYQIADLCRVSQPTILRRMESFGILRRRPGERI